VKKNDSLIEKVLLVKLTKGDREAFSAIFSAYYRDLVLFASGFTHESATAEEIVQDTFTKIWEVHRDLNITGSLRSYLLKTVQNRCIDWHRHNKIRQIHQNEVINESVLFEYNTDNYVFRSELESLIKKAMLMIPQECAEAFRMNREDGLKYLEIAEKLNVSQRTIEVRIGKALHLLRKHLADYL
jgi:RNA polymerase sigma-70 factor (family 1)